MQETVKLKAIVIRINQSGENDCMLTLISPSHGKITVIAKGVKSLKHQSRGSARLLCYSEFVLKKIKDGFYSLVSAEIEESFRKLTEDITLLSYGIYFSSLCEACIQSGVSADDEVRLLLNTLYVLCKRPEAAIYIKTVFELKICELYGIMPEFDEFCPCGSNAVCFCVEDGEVRCSEHKTSNSLPITAQELKIACFIMRSSLRDALFANAGNKDALSLWHITEAFLVYHIGNLPKSLEYLHGIVKKMQ